VVDGLRQKQDAVFTRCGCGIEEVTVRSSACAAAAMIAVIAGART